MNSIFIKRDVFDRSGVLRSIKRDVHGFEKSEPNQALEPTPTAVTAAAYAPAAPASGAAHL